MPVIKSAIKKMRQDKKREIQNNELRANIDRAIRDAKKTKSAKSVSSAMSLVDKGVKKNIMPKNRAARLKSQLSKISKPASKAKAATTKSETVKKTTSKATPKTTAKKSPKK